MRVVDAARLRKIQVMRLYNESFSSKKIARYLNRVNPRVFAITNDVNIVLFQFQQKFSKCRY